MTKTEDLVLMILKRYGKEDDFKEVLEEAREAGLLRKRKESTKKETDSTKLTLYNKFVKECSENITDKRINVITYASNLWKTSYKNPKSPCYDPDRVEEEQNLILTGVKKIAANVAQIACNQ